MWSMSAATTPRSACSIKQAREQGFNAQFVSEDALVTDEFWKIAGPAGEGMIMTFAPDPMENPKAKPVVDKFLKDGYKPEGYTLYTYAAFQVWAAGGQGGELVRRPEGRGAESTARPSTP